MFKISSLLTVIKAGMLGAVILLSACSQDYGEGEGRSAGDQTAGQGLYSSECASCHGPNGEGGSGGALIACSSCGTEESLIAKIEKDMPSASSPLRGADARNVAAYVLNQLNSSTSGSVARSLPGVGTMDPEEAVYKIAFELAGRLPTEQEVETFLSDLEGEKQVVYGFMESDYFYERLKDVFNDKLLTDRFRKENTGSTNSIRNLYGNTFGRRDSNNDFYTILPDLNWDDAFRTENNHDISGNYLEYFTTEALARKPLLFVEYLARNNRDFRELVSGKYTVVNRFSFEAFNNGENGPNVKLVDPDSDGSNGALELANASDVEWKTWSSQQELLDYIDVVALYENPTRNGDISQNYILDEFPYDPRDLKPVQMYYNTDASMTPSTRGVPHSGIITDEVLLNKYTATETNMHRNRAWMVYWFFAGKDLLAIEGNRVLEELEFEDFTNTVGIDDPTASNPDCIVCHEIMDPVAKAFQNYDLEGVYDITNPDEVPFHDDTIGWGLSKSAFQSGGVNGYNTRELQWLGEQVASDGAYPKGIAQIIVSGMTGQPILGQPGDDSPQAYRQAYSMQSRLIQNAAGEFAAGGFNIKDLIYAVTKSAYFRSDSLYYNGVSEEYEQVGSIRYLPPQLLNQKLRALNSGGWSSSLNLYNLNDRKFLGGKDSIDVFEDSNSVSGIVSAITERMAVDESCDIVRNEFNSSIEDRLLFTIADENVDLSAPTAAGRLAQLKTIRKQIARLHLAALHQKVDIDSEEVDIAYELFVNVLEDDPALGCGTGGNARVRKAWFAVMTYILSDYRFIYS